MNERLNNDGIGKGLGYANDRHMVNLLTAARLNLDRKGLAAVFDNWLKADGSYQGLKRLCESLNNPRPCLCLAA